MKTKTKKVASKKYTDGGKMSLSKNLVESRKATTSKKALLKKTRKSTKNMRKMVAITGDDSDVDRSPILFNAEMRRTFIKGVLQDIKGYFENRTDGKVEVYYEDFNVESHEFGFKLKIKRGSDCSKQMFSEVSSAVCSLMNYMMPAADGSTFTEDELVEFEILSNW